MKKPKPKVVVALAWGVLALLAIALLNLGPSLEAGWREEPPTPEQETDCRIDAMMGGDNPIEVGRIERECLQAALEASVAPRVRRFRVVTTLVLLVGFLGALGTTWHVLGSGATGGGSARR